MSNKIYLSDFRKEQCSIDCYKAMGSIPELHCQKCLRLFHHECMDLSKDANKAYICKVDKIINAIIPQSCTKNRKCLQ